MKTNVKKATGASQPTTDNRAAVKAQRRQAGADLKTAKAVRAAAKAKEREAAAAWQKQHGARHGVLLFDDGKGIVATAVKLGSPKKTTTAKKRTKR